MKTVRRLLAGFAAAGAFVAATALPAYAAPSFQLEASDSLVAPDSATVEYTFIWTEDDLSGKTIRMEIDTSKLAGARIGLSPSTDEWACDGEPGPLITCEKKAADGEYSTAFDYQLFGDSDARIGTVGAITFTVDIDGAKESATKKVTIAEASDLAAPQTVAAKGDPGGVAKVNLPVANVGESTVERFVLNFTADYRSPYVGDFGNCTDYTYFVV